MANRAYLTCCDFDRTYPSGLPDYDANEHTIAAGSYCVPLLWLGLFRLEDIRIDAIEADRQIYREPAPFAEKQKALAQLALSLEKFDAIFADSGSLSEHIDCLREAISSASGKYVSIELVEIAYTEEPADFYRQIELILGYLGGNESAEGIKDAIVEVSTLNLGREFPSPRGFYQRENIPVEDEQNLSRLLGYEWFRPVTWE